MSRERIYMILKTGEIGLSAYVYICILWVKKNPRYALKFENM